MVRRLRINERTLKVSRRSEKYDITDWVNNVKVDADFKDLMGYIVGEFNEVFYRYIIGGNSRAEDYVKVSDAEIIDDKIFITISSIDDEYILETRYAYEIDILTKKLVLSCDMSRDGNLTDVFTINELNGFIKYCVDKLLSRMNLKIDKYIEK